MGRYVKVADSLYEITFKEVDEKVINLALSSQPTLASFIQFCDSVGIDYDVKYISKYCDSSMVMHHAVFET